MLNQAYSESWITIYMNFVLGIGLGSLTLALIALVVSKLVRFVYTEYRQYQPNPFLVSFNEMITRSGIILEIFKQWYFPPPSKEILTRLDISEKNIDVILKMVSRLEEKIFAPVPSPAEENVSAPSSQEEIKSDLLTSLIKGSVDISNLDIAVKNELINSFITVIQGFNDINCQIIINNTELTAILNRISHNVDSIVKNESNSNLPAGSIYDMLSCTRNKIAETEKVPKTSYRVI